jgi:post-segregation antitoxin (ccd killing protein)
MEQEEKKGQLKPTESSIPEVASQAVRWEELNRDFIAECNARIEREGTALGKYRSW